MNARIWQVELVGQRRVGGGSPLAVVERVVAAERVTYTMLSPAVPDGKVAAVSIHDECALSAAAAELQAFLDGGGSRADRREYFDLLSTLAKVPVRT